tara:strand:+ start:752 stop:1102 length:351 start_codon:yes stop_codon:yes gene_type:complete
MSFRNNLGHLETIPESDPSYPYQPKQYGNNCQQRRFYLEAHQKSKPWRCFLPWASDLRCTDGFYTDQLDNILQAANLGPSNCANMDQRWESFKFKAGFGSAVALGLGLFVLVKLLD